MSISPNTLLTDPVHRLIVKLIVATVAVVVTGAIAFRDEPLAEPHHAPLSETATTAASDAPEATGTTTSAAAPEPGARP